MVKNKKILYLPIILTLSIGFIFPISAHAKTYKKDDQIVIKNPAYTKEFQERERKIKRKAQEIKEKNTTYKLKTYAGPGSKDFTDLIPDNVTSIIFTDEIKPDTATDGSRKYGSTKITVLQTGEVSVSKIANRTQLNVKNALKALGFSIVVDPQSSNSCDGTIRAIILSENSDSYVYHELGHFLAYVSENADKSSDFISIYNTEKGKYTGAQNRVANVSEYFAQSYEEYTKSTATANALRRERPLTYNYIKNCISNLSKLMKDASFTQMNLAGLRYNCGK